MNILYITQGFPEPQMLGGQISSYYRVVQLARAGHRVTVLCLVPDSGSETDPTQLRRVAEVVAVPDVPSPTMLRLLVNIFDPLPWPIRRYYSSAAAGKITELVHRTTPDLVFFNSLHSASLLPHVREQTDAPCLLFAPNVQSTIMRLFSLHQANPLTRFYAGLQWRKMRSFERIWPARFDLVCVYSKEDRDGLLNLSPEARVRIVPIALDLDAMGSVDGDGEIDILLCGHLGWRPNLDALEWFVGDIFPLVRKLRPKAGLTVVGPGAGRSLRRRLDDPAITFAGRVDDIASYYRTARVVVVPLRIGSGVRVKIVQALGAGAAVVSTTKGCEGLAVENEQHILVADDAGEFAAAVARLIDSPALRRTLGRRGRSLVEDLHDALAPDRPLVEICEALTADRIQPSQPAPR